MSEVKLLNTKELIRSDVEKLWENICKVEENFDDRTRGRTDYFVASLFDGTQYIKMGDIGVAAVMHIIPGADANVHVTFWDKSEPVKVHNMIREALKLVFEEFQLIRCSTVVGAYNKAAIRLTKLLGFQEEGRLRKGTLYKGKFYDSVIMGILREEFLTEGG